MNTGPPPPPGSPPKFKVSQVNTTTFLSDIIKRRQVQHIIKEPKELDWTIPKDAKGTKKVRIVVISDSHNHQDLLHVPHGDILIHCGDMTEFGKESEISKFNEWLGTLPHEHKIVICGNHEGDLARHSADYLQKKFFTNAKYLQDEGIVIKGIKFYGAPWVPNMGNLPNEVHMKQYDNKLYFKDADNLKEKWNLIPEDVNVLITHTPRFGCRDRNFGCNELSFRITQLKKLAVHMFGHVHTEYGVDRDEKTGLVSINAAVDDEEQPIVFDFIISE